MIKQKHLLAVYTAVIAIYNFARVLMRKCAGLRYLKKMTRTQRCPSIKHGFVFKSHIKDLWKMREINLR